MDKDKREMSELPRVIVPGGLGDRLLRRSEFRGLEYVHTKTGGKPLSAEGSPDRYGQIAATEEFNRSSDATRYDRNQFIINQYDDLAVLVHAAEAGDIEAVKRLPIQKLYVELATRKLIKDGILETNILENLTPKAEKLGINLSAEPEITQIDTTKSRREATGFKKAIETVIKVVSRSKD